MLIMASSCAVFKKADKSSESNIEVNLFNSALFIDAKRAEFSGDMEESIRILNQLAVANPHNHAVFFELSRIYGNINVQTAIDYGEQASDLDPENQWYLTHLTNLYVQKGLYKKAEDATKSLIKLHPYELTNYYQLVNIYIKANDLDNVLKTYKLIDSKFGFSEENTLRRKDILMKQKKYQSAADEMLLLIENQPDSKRYYGILADIYMAAGEDIKAIQFYQKVLSIDPNDGKVNMVLSSYYYAKDQPDESYRQMKLAFQSSGLDIDNKIEIMIRMHDLISKFPENEKFKNQADTLLLILNSLHPNDPKVLAMKGDYKVKARDWSNAKKAYAQVIAIDSSRYLVWENLILVCKEMSDFQSMQNYARRAMEIFPQYPILYFFNAQALSELGRFIEAEASLSLGLSFVYKPQQEVEFYTLMGKVRDSLQHFNEAEISYEKALMADPNNAEALISYAMHLALVGKENEKAVSLASKAVELNVNSTEFIYGIAKVFFLMDDYSKSAFWTKKGLQLSPDNRQLIDLNKKLIVLVGQ
jgi:tetratricopeptide (TPR) repeat protein